MPLYKQKGSEIWWLSISNPVHGRVRESTGEHDRTAAQKVLDRRAAELWDLTSIPRGSWGEAVQKWCEVEDRSDSELLSLAKFGRLYPDRALSVMTAESVEAALSFCKTAGTYTRYRTMITAILNLAGVKLKLATRKDKKKKARKWITKGQYAALLAELKPHMRPMVEFATETGLRQSNVLQLTWSRIDLARKHVWVEAEDMKDDDALPVPLSKIALRVLKGQQGKHKDFVFVYAGHPVSEIKTAFQSACLRAGIQGFTWHGLRHSWATWHVQDGTPLEVLQKLGGWSDMRMVMTYAHHTASHLAQYANNSAKGKK